MKKTIEKILIILVVTCLMFTMVGLNISYASEASISVGSATVGSDFTVTVTIPSDAVTYQGTITVKFSDSTTQTTGLLTKVTGIDGGDYSHPGNMTGTFTASSAGTATITVSGLIIGDQNNNQLNSNTTLTQTITVAEATSSSDTSSSDTSSSDTSTTTTTTTSSDEPSWTATGDTVYATEKLNVRSGWSTSYDKLGTLSKGSSVTRIAVGSNGWDKISYNGSTGYVLSQYLTTVDPSSSSSTTTTTTEEEEEEPTWTATGDTVYATQSVNVRSGWSTSYSLIGSLSTGDSVTRIATGSNGWDKIEYNGQTGYVISRCLSSEEVEAEEDDDENTVDEENAISDEETYNQIVEEIGVLPAVGKSASSYVFGASVCVAIAVVSYISYKTKEDNI